MSGRVLWPCVCSVHLAVFAQLSNEFLGVPMRLYTMAIAAICVAATAVLSHPDKAAATDADSHSLTSETRQRVTLAEQQRIPAERISRGVCMLELGADVAYHRAILQVARLEFDNNLNGLRDSDDDSWLLPRR